MLFGMTPFGWRFAGAVAGILMIPGMYLLGKQLTKKTSISALCGLLIFLDCQHLTQTQIATIDSFPVLFIIFAYFFMLRFIQSDLICTPRRKGLISLAASGFFMGLSIASKWIGIYAGLGLAVLFFWHCIRTIVLCNDAARQLQGGYLNEEEARKARAAGKIARWDAARRWFLVLATILMIVGYMTSLRLLLASSAIPLALVLIATLRIKRLEGPKQ